MVWQVHDLRGQEAAFGRRVGLGPNAQLAQAVIRQSRQLFGTDIDASSLRIRPVSLGTRSIYRLQAGNHVPALIVKRRSADSPADLAIVEIETSHEFAVLTAVWNALTAIAPPSHRVPRPLLALPSSGLLFMEESFGEAVGHFLRCWLFGLHSIDKACDRLTRCGEWLHSFSQLEQRIDWPQLSPQAAALLGARRSRHHVYRLVGLSGDDLVESMLEGIRKRLTAYHADASLAPRVEAALTKQLRRSGRSPEARVPVHGKFTPADVLIQRSHVSVVDLEQAGIGSVYLDPAYFLYQVYMITRWRPFGSDRQPATQFRKMFLRGISRSTEIDEADLDCFIAYYLVNSLRPGGGIAGMRARTYAYRWLEDWLKSVER